MAQSAELKNITKQWGQKFANRGVNLKVRAATIHALVGENGAGKTTAMKTLFGLIKPDDGEILIDDKPVRHWSPELAFSRGIGMVHQHFMLASPESVLDNLTLGAEQTRWGLRDRKTERTMLLELMKATGLNVPLEQTVSELPIGLQSRCEILKVLYRKANFLILDEPTAVLTVQEIADFLKTLKRLRDQGHTVLIVTHKLNEVMAVADEVTVLRAGQTVATRRVADTSTEELAELMVGRKIHLPKVLTQPSNTQVCAHLQTSRFNIELRPGEITGIAGIEGSGQMKLVTALADPASQNNIKSYQLFGQNARELTLADTRKMPIGLVPSDRLREGLLPDLTLTENLRLGREQSKFSAIHVFSKTSADEQALLKQYDVRPAEPQRTAKTLSGGNQQKLIIARELGSLFNSGDIKNSVLIAVNPTRGVDLGAIEFIHHKLIEAASAGAAVLLVSSELEELMSLSHRIGVFFANEIVRWFDGPNYDEQSIGLSMLTGAK